MSATYDNKPEILPCPFCGGENIRFTEHGQAFVQRGEALVPNPDSVWSTCCYDCGASFPNRYSRQLLVDCWNRRPEPSRFVVSDESPTETEQCETYNSLMSLAATHVALYGTRSRMIQKVLKFWGKLGMAELKKAEAELHPSKLG